MGNLDNGGHDDIDAALRGVGRDAGPRGNATLAATSAAAMSTPHPASLVAGAAGTVISLVRSKRSARKAQKEEHFIGEILADLRLTVEELATRLEADEGLLVDLAQALDVADNLDSAGAATVVDVVRRSFEGSITAEELHSLLDLLSSLRSADLAVASWIARSVAVGFGATLEAVLEGTQIDRWSCLASMGRLVDIAVLDRSTDVGQAKWNLTDVGDELLRSLGINERRRYPTEFSDDDIALFRYVVTHELNRTDHAMGVDVVEAAAALGQDVSACRASGRMLVEEQALAEVAVFGAERPRTLILGKLSIAYYHEWESGSWNQVCTDVARAVQSAVKPGDLVDRSSLGLQLHPAIVDAALSTLEGNDFVRLHGATSLGPIIQGTEKLQRAFD